jgi:hypothetical protein
MFERRNARRQLAATDFPAVAATAALCDPGDRAIYAVRFV